MQGNPYKCLDLTKQLLTMFDNANKSAAYSVFNLFYLVDVKLYLSDAREKVSAIFSIYTLGMFIM